VLLSRVNVLAAGCSGESHAEAVCVSRPIGSVFRFVEIPKVKVGY